MNLGMQPDRHGVLPERLDRMLELDAPPVDRVTLGRERIGDVLGRDRAEQLAFLARLAGEGQRHAAQRGGQLLRASARSA